MWEWTRRRTNHLRRRQSEPMGLDGPLAGLSDGATGPIVLVVASLPGLCHATDVGSHPGGQRFRCRRGKWGPVRRRRILALL
jgi:hypothetical protein